MREADPDALRAKLAARQPKPDATPAPSARSKPTSGPELVDLGLPSTLAELPDEATDNAEVALFVEHVISQLDIVQVYDRYIRKPRPRQPINTDEIQVSCPTPSHADKHPSASLNTTKGAWVCYGCEARGDTVHLVALSMGLDTRVPEEFIQVRNRICRDLGYDFLTNTFGHEEVVVPGWFSKREKATSSSQPVLAVHEAPAFFDLEDAAEKGQLLHEAPDLDSLDLPNTLAELDDIGGARKRDTMDRLRQQTGKKRPAPPPVAPKPTPAIPAPPSEPMLDTPATPPPRPGAMPRFILRDSSHPLLPDVPAPAPVPPPVAPVAPVEAPAPTVGVQPPKFPPPGSAPIFDWRSVVPKGSPLHEYMSTVSADDCPEEYHVANFLMLIGLIMGKDVFLEDEQPVYGNFFVCHVGDTGVGKSKPDRYITSLIRRCVPFEPSVWNTDGVRLIRNPGSGQYLTSLFRHETEVEDEQHSVNAAGKKKKPTLKTNPGVRALVRWNEFSAMVTKGDREGKTQPTLIELFDGAEEIGGGSLTHKEYSATNAFGSVTTSVQTSVLRSLVRPNDISNGFLNRFWFVLGNPKPKHPMGKRIDVLETCTKPVLALKKWAIDKHSDGKTGIHYVVDLSVEDGSGAEHVRFLQEVVYPMQRRDATKALLARLDLQFKKLVLLFSANMMEHVVSVSAVQQAEAYFYYLVQCYEQISSQLVATEMSELEKLVISVWERRAEASVDEYFTIAEMHRNTVLRRESPSIVAVADVVRNLVRAGVMEEKKFTPTNGRPSLRYRLTD